MYQTGDRRKEREVLQKKEKKHTVALYRIPLKKYKLISKWDSSFQYEYRNRGVGRKQNRRLPEFTVSVPQKRKPIMKDNFKCI